MKITRVSIELSLLVLILLGILGGVLQHFLFLKSFLGIDKGSHFIDFRSVIPWVRFDPLRCFVFLLLMNIFRGGSFWEIRGCGVNIVGMSTLISP